MGAAGSKLEKALGDQFPEGERYFGLENFGNTCYCNSVLQVRVSNSLLHRHSNWNVFGWFSELFFKLGHCVVSLDSSHWIDCGSVHYVLSF
ncbi:hypothetical protein Scep_019859 [Stephania cephalantha]|uniref:Peptidase C19 ubiquitin carboxyl-terminal hydrolase domain-containing protein n=1 Tax=Stephania cephalantha TaxID=152367 RepID=A0AAP0IBQ1_9MAGN